MSSSASLTFRLLDLPLELRKQIYEKCFEDSSISIRGRLKSKPANPVDDLLEHVDTSYYPSALTFTSQQIRHESRDLLDRAAIVMFSDEVVQTLHHHLSACPPQLLQRIKRIRFITFEYNNYKIDDSFKRVIECLPSLEVVEYCLNLVEGGWNTYLVLESMDDVKQFEERGWDWERDEEEEDRDEFLESITSIEAFASHAAAWTRGALPYESETLQMKTMIMAQFFKLDEPQVQPSGGAEVFQADISYPRISMVSNRYGLLTWDGQKLTPREMSEEQAREPDYHQIMGDMD